MEDSELGVVVRILVMVMAMVKTQGNAEWLKSSHCGRLSYISSLS